MSYMSIERRIKAAAELDPGLQALLGASGVFRWYINGIRAGEAAPAVITQVVSNPSEYTHDGKMSSSWARVQFRIFGGPGDPGAQAMEDVGQALSAFFATLQLSSRPAGDLQPNFEEEESNMPYQLQGGVTNEKTIDLIVFVED